MQNLSKPKTLLQIAIIGIVGSAIFIYLLFFGQPTASLGKIGKYGYQSPQIGGSFILTDQNGNIFNSAKLKGQVSLIYFGYTRCPYHCATALKKLAEIKKSMNKSHISLQVVFITIDPDHDTPEVLKEYLLRFDPSFIGLTGTIQQIAKVADKFKVYYDKQQDSNHSEHSVFLYLMEVKGNYLKHFCVTPNCRKKE